MTLHYTHLTNAMKRDTSKKLNTMDLQIWNAPWKMSLENWKNGSKASNIKGLISKKKRTLKRTLKELIK
jgi:hypothetical protein